MAQFFKNLAKNACSSLEVVPLVLGVIAIIGCAIGVFATFLKIVTLVEGFWGGVLAFATSLVEIWVVYIVFSAIIDTVYDRDQEHCKAKS